ncbi:hypothetical protein DN547_31070, partial [Burkholderia multivorans]
GAPAGVQEPVIGARLTQGQLAEWRARILARPEQYTVQADLPLSQAPTWRTHGAPDGNGSARIVPKPLLLRVFALA